MGGPVCLLQLLEELKEGQRAQQNSALAAGKFKGVWNNGGKINPWVARISINGVLQHLGMFKTAEAAARAFDRAVLRRDGRCAGARAPCSGPR